MSAGDELFHLIAGVSNDGSRPWCDEARRILDAHRAEVLAEAKTEVVAWLLKKGREQATWDTSVLASKVDRGAVRAFLGTGHYRDAMDEHRAEVLAADGQAYDGELAMLRGLVRTLRVVARPDEVDVAEVRRLLHHHAADDAAARAEKSSPAGADATPDFFQPGRTYAYDASGFTAPELLTLFRVVATAQHPETGKRQAFGWIRTAEDVAWSPYAEPADEWPACWTDVTEGGDR